MTLTKKIQLPASIGTDAVLIIDLLMKDHTHRLIIEGQEIEEMRKIHIAYRNAGGTYPIDN